MPLDVYNVRIDGPESLGMILPQAAHLDALRAAVGAGRIETMGDIINKRRGGGDPVLHFLGGHRIYRNGNGDIG
jgi:hypothetical protein